MPLPSPIPSLFAGLVAALGLLAALEAVRVGTAVNRNPGAARLARVFLALAAAHLLECAVAASPWARLVPHLHSTLFGLAYGFGPALWIVARRVAGTPPGRVPPWVHALPVIVGTTSLTAWLRTPAEGKIAYLDFLAAARPPALQFGGLVAAQSLILLGVLYAAAAERHLRARAEEDGADEDVTGGLNRLADTARRGRNAFLGYLPVFLVLQIAGWHTYQLEYVPSLLGAAVLVRFVWAVRTAPAIPASTGRQPRGPGRYVKASLPRERVRRLLSCLEQRMEKDRAYLNPELDLATLAASLEITAHQLSQLLNRELGASFADYVNGHRIREAQRILRDPARREETILAVALESGFRSKNTFNAAFRKHAGTTPSAFRGD